MPALFTIADFEDATGIEILPEDEPKIQFRIDAISNYIIDYTGYNFFPPSAITEKCTADYYGLVSLPRPVVDVTSVKNARTNQELSYWDWDGDRYIYNLLPHDVVTVTYTGGFQSIPDDVFTAAIDILRVAIAPADQNSLVAYTVGDVTEKYFKGQIQQFIDDFAQRTLDNYHTTEATWRLGLPAFHPTNTLPTL